MQLFRNPRIALATATTSAALVGAAGVAAVVVALDEDPAPVAAPQVTVTGAAPVATPPTGSVEQIYADSAASVVEITVSSGVGQSQGSGFVYDEKGRVITNQHVVDGATTAKVAFTNGKSYAATVVGTDPSTDLAVLDVDAPASLLEPLALGDSSQLNVGEGVVAIGSPFGLEQTVTTGIVSALNRQITAPNNFSIDGAIQTDAAINQGNSGGPLLDLAGKVIGVNAQIKSESGGNDGVGFAIPSNTVKRIAAGLIADGEVQHAYLGVATDDVESGAGARIAEVRAGTPAQRAGLEAGDVVTAIDGNDVASADALRTGVDARKPGDEVELTLRRGGETRTLTVTLGTRPSA